MTGFLVTMTLAGSACVLMGQSYIITTVAGSAKGLEDGGTGAQAVLILPVAVVADPAGNIYVSDQIYGRIRKIDGTTGIISTLTSVATFPSGMALDSAGAFLYVADDSNHRVRKVDTKTGETTTLAGTGSGGFSGDGHLATAARLRNPRAVWVDSNNNVFIADTKNNRIRRVDASTGVIRTIAGAGGQNMTVSTPSGTAALVDNNPAGDGGKATRAQLANPEGVIGDTSGNIYIADTNFHRIRKVDSAGIISTVAGLGTPGSADSIDAPRSQFNAPRGLALDSHGNLYIADSNNNRIPQLLFTRNFVRTVAGAGTAGDDKQALIAALNFPSGVSFDPAGNLLIADQNNSTIRRVDVKTHLISTVAGTSRSYGDGGPAKSAIFSNPRGVAVDKLGNIYVSDTNGHRVRKVSTSGVVDAFAGSGVSGNGPTGRAVSARISSPGCVAVDASGSVLFAGRLNSKIRRVDTNGVMSNVVSADAETLDKNGRLIRSTPASGYNGDGAIAVFSRPNILTGSSGSQHLSATGANLGGDGILSAGTGGNSSGPNCISADNSGNVYIADTGNNVIRKVDAGGIINTVVGYITVVPDKNGVPVNTGVVGSEGDGGLATDAQLNGPQGVGVDPNGKSLCIADTGNHVVRQVNLPTNVITTIAGITSDGSSDKNRPGPGILSRLSGPQGCAIDSHGNTFIADTGNHRILVVDPTGQMSVIAGGGSVFDSDGKAGIAAQLFLPVGITVDAQDHVYFTDRSGLIKRLTRAQER